MNILDLFARKTSMPTAETALPGRAEPIPTAEKHFVNGRPLKGPYPDGMRTAVFGLGCFWGAENAFWKIPGVYVTAVGYAGGQHAQPDLPGGLQRPDRPQRGGAGRLRPEGGQLRAAAQGVLRGP